MPNCEYCGHELTVENIRDDNTTCDYCRETGLVEVIGRVDMDILEEMGVVNEV